MATTRSGDPTETIIERQMLLRYARDKAGRERPAGESRLKYRFLTISRDRGTMGDAIAARVASRLGWQLFDKEIVHSIAESSHVRQRLVAELDERSENLIHDTVGRFLRMAEGGSFGIEDYHASLLQTLRYLAVRGQAVVVGRGANFALASEPAGFHVRIVASPEARCRRLAARWQISPGEARRRMNEIDSARRSFTRHHFQQELDSLLAYDQVFNSDRLTVDQVAESIVSAIQPGQQSQVDSDKRQA